MAAGEQESVACRGIGALVGMAQTLLTEIDHDIGLVVYQRQRSGTG